MKMSLRILTAIFCVIMVSTPIFTYAKKIQLDGVVIEQEKNAQNPFIINFITTDHTLVGLIDEGQFFYSVPSQGADAQSKLNLNIKYSPLLLDDSSLTVYIDEKPIKSEKLDLSKEQMQVVIPLENELIEPGFHAVKISFYGNISEKYCVDEDNPANWLTLLSSSTIELYTNGGLATEDLLKVYPYPYVDIGRQNPLNGTIVVPDQVTANELSSAVQVANYLSSFSVEQSAKVIKESQLKTIDTHLIAVGTPSQWTGVIKQAFEQMNLQVSKDHLVVDHAFIGNGENEKQIMLITAESDQKIIEMIPLLTESHYIEQLSGNQLNVKKMPKEKEFEINTQPTFKELQIPNTTLTGMSRSSQAYFYRLPSYVDPTKGAKLNVKFNFSETLLFNEQRQIDYTDEGELVVFINEIPYSIAVNQLEKQLNKEYYEVSIPIEAGFINEQKFLSFRFEANGLRNYKICEPPTNETWMFIHEDSYIQFETRKGSINDHFGQWPSPFVEQGLNETTIVLPNNEDTTIQQVTDFVNELSNSTSLTGLDIVYANQVNDAYMKDRHVIIIGNLEQHPYLSGAIEKLLIKQNDKEEWDVAEYQFLQETTNQLAFIQPSIWNNQRSLAVFSHVSPESKQWVSKRLIQYLAEQSDAATIFVLNKNEEILSYAPFHPFEVKGNSNEDNTNVGNQDGMLNWFIIGFIALTIVGSLLLLLFVRKSKRK